MNFDSKCKCGCGSDIKTELNSRLIYAQAIATFPFTISSGARCEEYNKRIGGSPNSSHIKQVAVDILAPSGPVRFRLVRSLIQSGFKRIGVYTNHIHTDIDKDKVDSVFPGSY